MRRVDHVREYDPCTYTFGRAAEFIVDKLRLRALRNILHQDSGYFDIPAQSHAMMVTRISIDAPNIKPALDSRMMQIVNNFASIIVLIILAIIFSWQIGLLGFAMFCALCLMQYLIANLMQKYNKQAIKEDLTGQLAIEIVEQVRTIQLLTREEYFHMLYDKKLSDALRLYKKSTPYEAFQFAVVSSFLYFADMASYCLGIPLIYYGYTEPISTFTSAISVATGGWALIMVAGCLNTFIMASSASDSIFRIINAKSVIENINERSCPKIDGEVQFKNVRFSYPSRPTSPILNGLSFTAHKGQSVAIVGPSGGGKSTIIALLERFYNSTSGEMQIDGLTIDQLSLRYLRDQMALVGQEPVLFSGTIAENILLGTSDKTMDDAYDTEVGERGSQLSGGQKQRIAIARALIRNPKILLLDEATSALDAESEKAVQEGLENASTGRTCLTVAHRLSSIQFADRIFFVENGKVIESGTHQELIEFDGKYADFIRKQDFGS
ncbi:unnamed protein product [Dracunculus medinensis]|uniref:P-loop containing nucleoside triphosphate hydrolase protein n=1 Tax=Dracunculus medinensis TaxID=318479 RepID=A0A158Q6K2_DRAME|nr:unnamed protein product [Dracunculus medinensis]